MKHVKKFESFQLDEGILDDMKAKVKGWFKGDKEEDPVDQKPSISAMKKNSARYNAPLPAQRPDVVKPKENPNYWNNRQPEKVSRNEWYEELESHGRLPFTEEEIEFFRNFKKMNKNKYRVLKDYLGTDDHRPGERYWTELDTPEKCSAITISDVGNGARMKRIIKLNGGFYLISAHETERTDVHPGYQTTSSEEVYNRMRDKQTDYFLCDQFGLVIGYLKKAKYDNFRVPKYTFDNPSPRSILSTDRDKDNTDRYRGGDNPNRYRL